MYVCIHTYIKFIFSFLLGLPAGIGLQMNNEKKIMFTYIN